MPKLSPKVFNKEEGSPVQTISHTGTGCSSLLADASSFEESFNSFLKKNMTSPEYLDSSENATFTRCKRTDSKFLENNNIKFCKENIPFRDIIKDSPHRRNKYLGASHHKPTVTVVSWKEETTSLKKTRRSNCGKGSENRGTKDSNDLHDLAMMGNSNPSLISEDGQAPMAVEPEEINHSVETEEEYVAPKRRKLGRPFGSKNVPKKLTKTKHSKRIKSENQRVKQDSGATDGEDSRYSFGIGQDVLARWNDGLFYLGSVQKIEKNKSRCFVRFEDQSEYWILFKDLQKGAKDDEISCCVCQTDQSEKPNEIVLCDNCGLGYHQACHNPTIGDDVLAPDVEWCCRLCIFATAVKEGGALKSGPDATALQQMKQTFPYKLETLTWDVQHKVNVEQCYCYCGGPGDWHKKMLQCCRCRQWFHEACIQCLEYPLVFGDRFYLFVCSHCNKGPEYIKRLEMTWADLTHLALFNLTIQLKTKKKYYSSEDIVEFITVNWEKLQLSQFESVPDHERIERVKKSLKEEHKRFGCGENRRNSMYTLKLRAPPSVPTLILPLEGQVTDEVLQNLQLTGNKKVKKFIPIICKSPVPLNYRGGMLEIHDSIALKSRKNLSLAITKNVEVNPYSANQEYKGYTGKNYSVKSRKHSGTLSSLIPVPEDYDGYNHPFLTECEQNHQKALARRKHDLQKYLFYTTELNIPTEDSSQEETSVASPEAPEEKKSRKRKHLDESAVLTSKRRRVTVSQEAEKNYVEELLEQSDSVKTDMSLCFDTVEKMKKGEKYFVGGKRTVGGCIQYLVKWEGLHTK